MGHHDVHHVGKIGCDLRRRGGCEHRQADVATAGDHFGDRRPGQRAALGQPDDPVALDTDPVQRRARGQQVLTDQAGEHGAALGRARPAEPEEHDGALGDVAAEVDVRRLPVRGWAQPAAERRRPDFP